MHCVPHNIHLYLGTVESFSFVLELLISKHDINYYNKIDFQARAPNLQRLMSTSSVSGSVSNNVRPMACPMVRSCSRGGKKFYAGSSASCSRSALRAAAGLLWKHSCRPAGKDRYRQSRGNKHAAWLAGKWSALRTCRVQLVTNSRTPESRA